MTHSEFVNKIKMPAIISTSGTGLFPSVAMAQACLESGYGASQLANVHNDYFGIKAGSGWSGSSVEYQTSEANIGTIFANFRVYGSMLMSFRDRTTFLTSNKRYKTAISTDSAIAQCIELQKAGYATDPNYADKLISIINQYNLISVDTDATKIRLASVVVLISIVTAIIMFVYI